MIIILLSQSPVVVVVIAAVDREQFHSTTIYMAIKSLVVTGQ